MGEKTSINYIMANEKIRNLVFEEWEKFNLLINQGPDILKKYFCKLWDETKMELEYLDDIDVIDLDKKIKPEEFGVSYSILDNEVKILNFIMPKPVNNYGQAVYISAILTSKIPRFFTLEFNNNLNGIPSYIVGEWQIDFQNNDYIHKRYGTIEKSNIGEYLGIINQILQTL